MKHYLSKLIFVSSFFLCCFYAAGLSAQNYGTVSSALIAPASQADDCTPEYQAFNDKILMFGRITASTKAFEECLRTRIAEKYRECRDDPFYGETIATQTSRVLAAARNMNGLHIKCTGGSGNASTQLGSYGDKVSDEFFSWSGWFGSVHAQLSQPVCRAGQESGRDNCRFAAYPWPYSQAAGIVWHEVMHQQGYTHGANEQAPAKIACGYASDPTWNYQQNTMPYIVGNAISEVIRLSAERCDLDACAAGNQLQMITSYRGTSCNCVSDPGQKGLALMQYKAGKIVDQTIRPNGDWIGSWHLGADNKIETQGDFNGDGVEDFVITSGWGIGIFSHNGDHFTQLMVKPNGTRFGGWNFQSSANKIIGAGDFNGDGKDDLVVSSSWGLGILTLQGNSLAALVVKPSNTAFGGWRYDVAKNNLLHIGDFTGNNRANILVTSDWGIGVLQLQGSSLTAVVAKPNGTRFGGWNYQTSANKLPVVGDFNGDGKDDVAITSNWGVGLLTVSGNGFSALSVKPNDTWFGGWRYTSTSVIRQAADLDGDGKDELVVTSPWGIGVLRLNGTTLAATVAKPNGTRFGGWNFSSTANTIGAAGDINGDRREDLLISSNWGVGVLTQRGDSFALLDANAYGKLFGSWPLQRTDDFNTVGSFSSGGGKRLLFKAAR